jgi:hypothetical protein
MPRFEMTKFVFACLAVIVPLIAQTLGLKKGPQLFQEDFDRGLANWSAELEQGGMVNTRNGALVIDVPAGATVWFRHKLEGPVLIQYEATVIVDGGRNDRLSDLNCFWMATDMRTPRDLFAKPRAGKFADYNQLTTYYVGQGGNGNTTTRFRRYIGDRETRPLLPEHDLSSPDVLLKPNVIQQIQLIAAGDHIEYARDGTVIFDFRDPRPYTAGHFALRTTHSHIELRKFRVSRLGNFER